MDEQQLEITEEIIQYVGLDQLDEKEKAILNKLSSEYHGRIKRILNNNTSLVVHIKKFKKEGKANKEHKFNITVKTVAPTRPFRAAENDWNLNTAIRAAFEKLEKELEKAYVKKDFHKTRSKFTPKKQRK